MEQPSLYLPQLGEEKLPLPMDVAGGVLLYDKVMLAQVPATRPDTVLVE